ncbi:MAG: PQQ-binding-like beta-propeller repeat protein [Planctomycetaceae bacterium]|nr:PQQ-binding-like beta-propeller repeat protein [Planctomycetaceae bacterium]
MGEKESNVSRATGDDQSHHSAADFDNAAQQELGSGDVSATSSKYSNIRIWPAVLFLAAMVVAKMLPSMIENGPSQIWMSAAFGPLLGALLVLGWWLLASRARWQERLLGLIGLAVTFGLAAVLLHPTMLGPAVLVLTIPLGVGAFAMGTIVLSRVHSPARTGIALLMAFIGFGYTDLLRAEGMWGDFAFDLHWRWAPDAEDRLLASQDEPKAETSAQYSKTEIRGWLANPEWSGFRGQQRDSRQRGAVFTSDWESRPPKEQWRVPVGPGWSSFAVAGNLLYTQEQVSDRELISCYDAVSGGKIWTQGIESRFDDPLGGPGPRGTPTLAEGGVFSLGAQGWLSRVDPVSGELIWKQDLREVAQCSPPMWGFCSSPLVVDGLAIVYAGGGNGKGLLAFNAADGEVVWAVQAGRNSYASAQLATIAGQVRLLMLTGDGLSIHELDTGKLLFDYEWESGGYRSLQPQVIDGNKILLPSGMGTGTRLIELDAEDSKVGWSATELWTTLQFKPDYNDFVVYEGNLYGFDSGIFTCIDLKTGERQWKGGRYGKGQVLLLEDSGLLLIAAEKGQLVLLEATPEARIELFKMDALDGRTWNHPVVVGDRLYLRNSSEAVAFQLPVLGTKP